MLENFTKICEIDRSEMINQWTINLPKLQEQPILTPLDAVNWNEKEIFQCQLKVQVKAEEEKKHESESSDSEEDSVINLNLILNLPEEKLVKIRIAEKIDDFFDDQGKM